MPHSNDPRELLRRDFIARHGWGDAVRKPLTADASTRRYERLHKGEATIMLMDAPVSAESPPCPPEADEAVRNDLGWNAQSRLAASRVEAFACMADYLRTIGLSAPQVLAVDAVNGLALIEDLGDAIFAREIEKDADEIELYKTAASALAIVHQIPAPRKIETDGLIWPILEFDALALKVNADLFVDWYPQLDPHATVTDTRRAEWNDARDGLIEQALAMPRALILRDYHAENLIWLPDRAGAKRAGLLDFQDAVNGWPEWDFAMLVQDARRHVSPAAADAAISHYLDLTGGTRTGFDRNLAILGALNALRVAGIFSRLIMRDDKPRYRDFQPRQLDLLVGNLNHPALKDMRDVVAGMAPHLLNKAA